MNETGIILNRLLDKYENSVAFVRKEASSRRVLLKCDRSGFPEYVYTDVAVRDTYNEAAIALSERGLIFCNWVPGREKKLLKEIWLNVEKLPQTYTAAERMPLDTRIRNCSELLNRTAEACPAGWIKDGVRLLRLQLLQKRRFVGLLKNSPDQLRLLLTALHAIATKTEFPIPMRVFSIACYRDSKLFEREVAKQVVLFAKEYEPIIHAYFDSEEVLEDKEVLDYMGILSRAEQFELCGPFAIEINGTRCECGGFRFGMCVSSLSVPDIQHFDLSGVSRILFIENKTNYEAYVQGPRPSDELVIYHGGFSGPAKIAFFQKLRVDASPETTFCFWADIDLGGFLMFAQLCKTIPVLCPYRMDAQTFRQFQSVGLARKGTYLDKLRTLRDDPAYARFIQVIDLILQTGVTIEQEAML